MRILLLFVLILCTSMVSAEPYKGFGVTLGDTFDYTITFDHRHIGEETESFLVYDLRELDNTMNDSVLLVNQSSFRVEIGDYSGSRFTKPDRIPSFVSVGNITVALADVPQLLIHDINWGTYRERLERRMQWTDEIYRLIETDDDIGYYREWFSEIPDVNNTFTITFDKRSGMTNYYLLDTVVQHDDYLSYTYVEINLIDDSLPPEFKIPGFIGIYFGVVAIIALIRKSRHWS